MEESCKNCKYRTIFKELINGKWFYRNCCYVMAGGEYGFVIPVELNDICECWEEDCGTCERCDNE